MSSEITDSYSKLTRHPEGSVRELWSISLPMMLALLSGNLMLVVDRIILAQYSIPAMNAAAAAGMTFALFQYGTIGIASIAEVFVGQLNGAGKQKEAGRSAWQMIWFSALTILLFYPLALFAGPYLLADYHRETMGIPYFNTLLYFGPIFPLVAALSGFFVGLGKTRLILVAAIAGNIINIGLDWFFVFGIPGWLEPMGTMGAALATGISQAIQAIVLLFYFLSNQSRKDYGSGKYQLDIPLFTKSLRVGGPASFGHMIEIGAWAVTMRLVAAVGTDHLTVTSIGQSLYTLVAFAMEGLQKGVTTIAANFIGGNKFDKVYTVWRSGAKLTFIFALGFGLLLLINPDPIVDLYLPNDLSAADRLHFLKIMRSVSFFIWFYFIVDSLTWISAAILTAGGDTLFIGVVGGITAWVTALMPIYLFIVIMKGPPALIWGITCFYGVVNFIAFSWRMRAGKWKQAIT